MKNQDSGNFWIHFDGIADLIESRCALGKAHEARNPEQKQPEYDCKALWDTGANISAISAEMISRYGLTEEEIPITIKHGGGKKCCVPVFRVTLRLPNGVDFPDVKVARGCLDGYDVLIGMDVIGQGDFFVMNGRGKTDVLFRYPAVDDGGFGEIPNEGSCC